MLEAATVKFSPEALTGAREERRILFLTLAKPGPWDVTISFRAKNDAPDLGGRDRVQFLVRCLDATAR